MSFGLSHGNALDVGEIGIDLRALPPCDEGRIDPRDWFDNPSAPLEIEIGSGKGTFLVQESKERLEPNYLGFEWASEFYRYAADRIRRHHLTNVKMMHGDATEFLRFLNIARMMIFGVGQFLLCTHQHLFQILSLVLKHRFSV